MTSIRDRGLRRVFPQVIQDGNLSKADVDKLIASVKDGRGLSKTERKDLQRILDRHSDQMDPAAREMLVDYLGQAGNRSQRSGKVSVKDKALRKIFSHAMSDGNLSKADVEKLITSAQDGRGISKTERKDLTGILNKHGGQMDPAGREMLMDYLGLGQTPETGDVTPGSTPVATTTTSAAQQGSVINEMQTAPLITLAMVREAIKEVQSDRGKINQLQQVADTRQGAFQNVRCYDQLVGFLQQYFQDRFEFRDVTHNPAALPPQITEARITKLKEVERTVDITPPPPPPARGRYRDPLNITGHAEAGSKVEFYNASQPGRPVIGSTTADADGKFRFELTDESKFEYGDQIGVRVLDDSGQASKPVVVPTEPFLMTTTTTTFVRRGATVRTDISNNLRALDAKHDTRNPFFQQDKVAATFTPPKETGQPYALELVGSDDAVEPNSTVKVTVNGQDYVTRADSMGKFGLKVFGFEPGQKLKVEIKDINGKGIDVDYKAPDVELNTQALTRGVLKPPMSRKPSSAREVMGDGPPWVHFKAAHVTVPDGAVILRNIGTGDVFELHADAEGSINAAVGGIESFDTLEIVARDANGNISDEAEVAVMLPEKIRRGVGFFVPVAELDQAQPDVTPVIEAIEGPPLDMYIGNRRDPRGPFLKMPDVDGMPPFGQLAVEREGKIIQYLRADQNGKLLGLLRGVNVGDQLNFQVLDAAGRKFPMELHGWKVPGAGQTNGVPKKHIRSADRTLDGAISEIGKGTLDLQESWLQPFTVNSGAVTTPDSNVPLHYKREFFGARSDEGKNESSFDYFPPALHKKFGLPPMHKGKLSMETRAGTRRLSLDYTREVRNSYRNTTGYQTSTVSVGVDYVMGQVNMGDPNHPVRVPEDLQNLTNAMKGALAYTALAYENGKEPGDMEYDRAIGAVKTMLYVFDRLAVEHPDQKDAIVAAAKAAYPSGGFNYELLGRFKVPPQGARAETAEIVKPRTSAMSVLDARTALMGKISGVGTVGQAEDDSHPAPRIESASILALGKARNSGTGFTYDHSPLRVRGRATPGDIVQVYNVSTGNKTLIGEAVVGRDGRFALTGGYGNIKNGDQLGVMSITQDGKRSALMVVPTDSYLKTAGSVGSGIAARPLKSDSRPPYFRVAATELKNVSFDAAGKPRGSNPMWRLSGGELSVEPFSTVTISSTTPDGEEHSKSVEVDAEGHFSLEFEAASRSNFRVYVQDRNDNRHNVNMSTPGLADSIQTGDALNDVAAGVVMFRIPGGEDIRGVVVGHTLGNMRSDDIAIKDADRNDDFVDVYVTQKFAYTGNDGQQRTNRYYFKIKLSKEDAARFDAQPNDKVMLSMPGFNSVQLDGSSNIEMTPSGEAQILDRDYGSPF